MGLEYSQWQVPAWVWLLTSLHTPLGGKGWVNLVLDREGPHTGKAGGRWPSYGCVWNTHRKAGPTQQRTAYCGAKGREGATAVPMPAYPGSVWDHTEKGTGQEIQLSLAVFA